MADDWCDDEVKDVLVGLEVVRSLVEWRLGHPLEVIVVYCLGLAKGVSSKSRVAGHRDHLVTIQDHKAVGHI